MGSEMCIRDRMEYGAPEPFRVRVRLGDTTRELKLPAGPHTAYFRADGSYDSVELTPEGNARGACVTSLVLGNAVPPPAP